MLITEYRIPLPLSLSEYQIGQLHTTLELSKKETNGGEGVEILKNEAFCNYPLVNENPSQFNKGQYTYKIYHLKRKVPSLLRYLIPQNSLELHEEAWNAFPYCKTELYNPGYMRDGFSITVRSHHFNNDSGEQENVHGLAPDLLRKRNVVHLDIVNDYMAKNLSTTGFEYDLSTFKSSKVDRGPFLKNWMQEAKPVMTCYKLVMADFKWFGLQTRVEKLIHSNQMKLFYLFHRMMICTMDDWHSMSINDIRKKEELGAIELHNKRRKEGLSGTLVTESPGFTLDE